MTLTAGTRLGPYQLISVLGAGGMGEVYRAQDTRLGRSVALKVLSEKLALHPEKRLRFEQEARAASALNHPNIVTIYDIGSADGALYIAMEIVEGKTLRDLVTGPLPVKKYLDFAAQAADGLAKAHAAGIVHRDLKPENLMISGDGLVKILDFGLAKLTTRALGVDGEGAANQTLGLTDAGAIVGTVGYMSPEQATEQPVDFRSDQFALGAILYEMATGVRAFRGRSAVETLTAIVREDPRPIAAVNPSVPAPFRWIVERCLAKEPADRYASSLDLARELKSLRDHASEIASGAITAPRAPVPPAAAPSSLRSSLLTLIAVVLLPLAFLAGRRLGERPEPVFERLTYRRGWVPSARFAPDGQTVLFGAAWDGRPVEVYSTRLGSHESRALGFPPADLLAVSGSGELALQQNRRRAFGEYIFGGTLARVPMTATAPREVAEGVLYADWSPDGRELAAVRETGGVNRLELPVGKVLYETKGWLSHVRFAPDGASVAVLEHPRHGDDSGAVVLVQRDGSHHVVSDGWSSLQGLAFSPRGKALLVTGSREWHPRAVFAVSRGGAVRRLLAVHDNLTMHDVARDGRLLLTTDVERAGIVGRAPGDDKDRDLSWFDCSFAMDLSEDGRQLLFSEGQDGTGGSFEIFLRTMAGGPAVRLGPGRARALSPDGRWVLYIPTGAGARRLALMPTAAGEARVLSGPPIEPGSLARFFPDGRRILFTGQEPGMRTRLYVQDLAAGGVKAISDPGVTVDGMPISPDGLSAAALDVEGTLKLYPADGSAARTVSKLLPGELPIRFGGDGRSLYVGNGGEVPMRVHRLDLATSRRELWKELQPPDPSGVVSLSHLLMTADGRAYAYSYNSILSNVYLVSGLSLE